MRVLRPGERLFHQELLKAEKKCNCIKNEGFKSDKLIDERLDRLLSKPLNK